MRSGNYGHALADVDFSFNHDTGELTVDDARMLGVEDINACENQMTPSQILLLRRNLMLVKPAKK